MLSKQKDETNLELGLDAIFLIPIGILRFVVDNGFYLLGELLLEICFWREGFEGAFGPERRGRKGVLTWPIDALFML